MRYGMGPDSNFSVSLLKRVWKMDLPIVVKTKNVYGVHIRKIQIQTQLVFVYRSLAFGVAQQRGKYVRFYRKEFMSVATSSFGPTPYCVMFVTQREGKKIYPS